MNRRGLSDSRVTRVMAALSNLSCVVVRGGKGVDSRPAVAGGERCVSRRQPGSTCDCSS